MKLPKNTKLYLLYTIFFLLISCIIFSPFWVRHSSFIWNLDGQNQHYILLKDFNEMFRNFFANPSKGIDLFSWNMGLGYDVIGQYSYFILGDAFAYLSLLFPIESLDFAYSFLVVLRLFCIGLSFLVYANYRAKKEGSTKIFPRLLGALCYAFCNYALFAGVRHPYFSNALILFPLLVWGVDKLLDENKKIPLILFVTLSVISNFYFFYMHAVMLVLYAIVRYLVDYRKEGWKHFLKKFWSGILCFVIGICIAGFLFAPSVYSFLTSCRSTTEVVREYDFLYYIDLFTNYFSSRYWSLIGISSISIALLPLFWTRRKEQAVPILFLLICMLPLLIPLLGSAMNGFSFPSNRWSFIFVFFFCYVVTRFLEKEHNTKELKWTGIFLSLYALVCLIVAFYRKFSHTAILSLAQLLLAFLMYGMFFLLQKERVNKIALVILYALAIASICLNGWGIYGPYGQKYADSFIPLGEIQTIFANQVGNTQSFPSALQKIQDQDHSFYRIARYPHTIPDISIYYGYPSLESYFSLHSQYLYDLHHELADNHYITISFSGLGDRSKITTLLGTKYYVTDQQSQNIVPYGYLLKEETNDVNTYVNQYPLSLGVSYPNYLLKSDYNKLTPLEKEDALLKTAVLEDSSVLKNFALPQKEDLTDIHSCYEIVPYEITDPGNALQEHKLSFDQLPYITLKIPTVQKAELYVYFSDFEYTGENVYSVAAAFQEKFVTKLSSNVLNNKAYFQRDKDVLLNLGYYDEAEGEIILAFSELGDYLFDKLQVIAVPMENYPETIQNLQENTLQNLTYSNREIHGIVDFKENRILQLSTVYTPGWKASVDGNPVDTVRVNTAFIGIPVEAGEHTIDLYYETPFLKTGIGFTCFGLISLIALSIWEYRKKKRHSKLLPNTDENGRT